MIRTGIGYDIHPLTQGRKLILGGVEIASDRGLLGHSDADVLSHAIADALLGAIAAGDIGMHFPNTDGRWRDASSLELLRLVAAQLARQEFRIVNVDSTLIAEAPRVSPFSLKMRENIAGAIGVGVECVSVKATTNEQLGALGRGEGIAAMAIATVERF